MSLRERRATKKSKREAPRKKIRGSTSSSESGGEEEHELFHYAGDRVQLMKEVLKILKSKKIKSLAPDSIKNLDMEEINTMLLEELLGISNKRLKKILDGQNADDESSSSSEDGDKAMQQIDIISLDDVSDDDLCLIEDGPSEKNKKDPNNDKTKNSKKHRIKREPGERKVKREPVTEKEKLLSVLELLELQARARAIRSQIALETDSRPKEPIPAPREEESDDEDAVIVEILQSPKEIVISSSDSEPDSAKADKVSKKSTKRTCNMHLNEITMTISNDAAKNFDKTTKSNHEKANKNGLDKTNRSDSDRTIKINSEKANKHELDKSKRSDSDKTTKTNSEKANKPNLDKNNGSDSDKTSKSNSENSDKEHITSNKSDFEKSNSETTNKANEATKPNSYAAEETVSEIPLPSNGTVEPCEGAQSDCRNSPRRGGNQSFGDSGNKTDSEDDVIRLDVVEIEGIDD